MEVTNQPKEELHNLQDAFPIRIKLPAQVVSEGIDDIPGLARVSQEQKSENPRTGQDLDHKDV